MPWISVLVCVGAAVRLWETPLRAVSVGIAAISVTTLIALYLLSNDGRLRAATALQHFTLACGGFLLFVSIAMKG